MKKTMTLLCRSLFTAVLFLLLFLFVPIKPQLTVFADFTSATPDGKTLWVAEIKLKNVSDAGTKDRFTMNIQYTDINGKKGQTGEFNVGNYIKDYYGQERTPLCAGQTDYFTFTTPKDVQKLTNILMDVHSSQKNYDNICIEYIKIYKVSYNIPIGELKTGAMGLYRSFSGTLSFYMHPSDGINNKLFSSYEREDLWDDSTFQLLAAPKNYGTATKNYVLELGTAADSTFDSNLKIFVYADCGIGVDNAIAIIDLNDYAGKYNLDRSTSLKLLGNSTVPILFQALSSSNYKNITRIVVQPQDKPWFPSSISLAEVPTGAGMIPPQKLAMAGLTDSMAPCHKYTSQKLVSWTNTSNLIMPANENTELKATGAIASKTLDTTMSSYKYVGYYPVTFYIALQTKDYVGAGFENANRLPNNTPTVQPTSIYMDITYETSSGLNTIRCFPLEAADALAKSRLGSSYAFVSNANYFTQNQTDVFPVTLTELKYQSVESIKSITIGNTMENNWDLHSLSIYSGGTAPTYSTLPMTMQYVSGEAAHNEPYKKVNYAYCHPQFRFQQYPILYYAPYGGFQVSSQSPAVITYNSSGTGNLKKPDANLKGYLNDGTDAYRPFEPTINYQNTYLFEMHTSNLKNAVTDSDMSLTLTYLNTQNLKSTVTYHLNERTDQFYGKWYFMGIFGSNYYHPQNTQDSKIRFLMELNDVKQFLSVTVTLDDPEATYQFDSIDIFRLNSAGYVKEYSFLTAPLYRERDIDTGEQLAGVAKATYLNPQNSSKTLNFIAYVDGEQAGNPDDSQDSGLTSIKKEMAYDEINQDLKLTKAKSNYVLNVNVSPTTDSGSTNYFFFQLVFDSGSSGVVLANEQIAGDAFRQGETASFNISTNQYYGMPRSVRIYTHSTNTQDTTTFDKLKIDSVEIIRESGSGLSNSWLVENVGWIDINYAETDIAGDGTNMNSSADSSSNGSTSVCREYFVTKSTSAMDFLVEFEVNPLSAITTPAIAATLYYTKNTGAQGSLSLDLNGKIDEFNGVSGVTYVPGSYSRFYFSLSDVASLNSIEFTSDKKDRLGINYLKISRVSKKGDVFLDATGRYNREGETTFVTRSSESTIWVNMDAAATMMLTKNENMNVSFTTDKSGVTDFTSGNSTPPNVNETLNVYVYPGMNSSFQSNLAAAIKYSGIYESGYMQKSFTIPVSGRLPDGALAFRGLSVSNMGAVSSMILSCEGNENPSVSHAIIERVSNNRKVNTYYVDFGNNYLVSPVQALVDFNAELDEMKQTVTITTNQTASQAINKTDDIGVSIRYKSSIDNTIAYLSDYVYLSSQAKNSLSKGDPVTINLYEKNVGEITAVSLISTGNVRLTTNTVYVSNYNQYDELLYATGIISPISLEPGAGNINKAIYYNTSLQNAITVMPVIFTFETAKDAAAKNMAGTYSNVYATLVCKDPVNSSRTVEIDLGNIRDYFSKSNSDYTSILQSGKTNTFTTYLPGTGEMLELRLRMDSSNNDPWTIAGVKVNRKLPDGTYETKNGGTAILSSSQDITIDLRVPDPEDQIQSQLPETKPSEPGTPTVPDGPLSEETPTVSGNR